MQIIVFFLLTSVLFLLLHFSKTLLIAAFDKHDFGSEYGPKKYFLTFITSVFSLNSFIFIVGASSFASGIFYLEFLLSRQYPYEMVMEMDQARILGFGSILLIIIPLISIFNEDMKRLKEYSSETEISENLSDDEDEEIEDTTSEILKENSVDLRFIRYLHAYTKYKEKTKNPELLVKSIVNDTIYIYGNEYRNFFDKKLRFALRFKMDTTIAPNQESCGSIPSPDIAICQLENLGTTHTQFKILYWSESDDYLTEITKIRSNQDFSSLRPFIQLYEIGVGEKCSFNEMETTMKTLDKMKKMIDDEGL